MPILRRSLIAALPATLIAVVFVLLFIDKAYTVDDATFLFMAQHMLVDPLHYSSFDHVFHGIRGRASSGVSGPVMPALLLPAVAAGGAGPAAPMARPQIVVFRDRDAVQTHFGRSFDVPRHEALGLWSKDRLANGVGMEVN